MVGGFSKSLGQAGGFSKVRDLGGLQYLRRQHVDREGAGGSVRMVAPGERLLTARD
jgi:hypothetical protein